MTARPSGFPIGRRRVGPDEPVFVIAEAGVNHGGDPEAAAALIDAAADAGADAVKFQTFDPESLASAEAPLADYQRAGAGAESQVAMLDGLRLPPESYPALKTRAEERGIEFLSTPFDEASAQQLSELGVPAFKVGSGDLTNQPLLASLASRGLPLIVSTGMASLEEVEAAVNAVGDVPLALLHCVSSYPAPAADANLRALDTLRERFGVPVGWSDHCLEDEVALAAVARGACIVEKHLTLDRTLPGPDQALSLEPDSFAQLVRSIRLIESALGDGVKRRQPSEEDVAQVARRSLVAARDIQAGEVIQAADVHVKRPGGGVPASELGRLIGTTAQRSLTRDEPFTQQDLV